MFRDSIPREALPTLLGDLAAAEQKQAADRKRKGDEFVDTTHSLKAADRIDRARKLVDEKPSADALSDREIRRLRNLVHIATLADARHELVTNEKRIERKRGNSGWNRVSVTFMDRSIDFFARFEFFRHPPEVLNRVLNAVYRLIRSVLAPVAGRFGKEIDGTESASLSLADLFRRVGLVFEQHGQIAEEKIRLARELHDATGRMTPERAREICELAVQAGKSADAYDKLRTVLLECGVANVMTPLITIALEFVYRWMERNGHRRWDEAGNIIASLKEFIPYETINLFGYRFPIMGRDMSIQNPETRGALFSELRGSVVESGGNLALSWFFKKHTGVGLAWARLAVAPLIGAAASAESYRKVNPEVKGHLPTSFFAALGAVNGWVRFVPAQFFIKWFFPKVPTRPVPAATDFPEFAFNGA